MGNPTVTRLGRTQFWYKKWYTDLSYNSLIKTTYNLETLLNFYFKYGLSFTNNFFYHNYWYKNKFFKKNIHNQNTKITSLYFRKYYYAHQTLTIEHSYFLRLKTPEYFPLKLYVLKYSNWLIASIQWFKPLKSTRVRQNNFHKKNKSTLMYTRSKSHKASLRTKILLTLLLSLYKNTNLKYYF